MQNFHKLSGLQTWKRFLWVLTGGYGLCCLWMAFNAYSQALPENTAMLYEAYLPHYLAFGLLLLHTVTVTILYNILER